jgi:hypothetical protein
MTTHVESPKFDVCPLGLELQTARWLRIVVANVLMAGILGAGVVATPMGPRELAAIIWMIALVVLVRRVTRRGEPRLAAMSCL